MGLRSSGIGHANGYTPLEEYSHGFLGIRIETVGRASSSFDRAEATSGWINPFLTFHTKTDRTEVPDGLYDCSCLFLSVKLDEGESVDAVC